MPQKTKTRWVSVSLRLFVFISLLVITPLGILKAAGYGYSMWFLIALVVILLPDAFIKLFLQPIAVTWDEQQLVFTYLWVSSVVSKQPIWSAIELPKKLHGTE